MSRRFVAIAVLSLGLALCAWGGYWVYNTFVYKPPTPVAPDVVDTGDKLPTQAEFDELAKSDPVKLLSACLIRYRREVRDGMRCTIEIQERVKGVPAHPVAPPVQVIEVCVRGDVADAETKQTAIEVVMKWRSGAKRVGLAEIRGTLFSERREPDGLDGRFVTWRPDAFAHRLTNPMPPNNAAAQGESRYCIRDAGIYRSMLRTHEAWKARQSADEFESEYKGIKTVAEAGGRECHVIRRICPRTELDAFELGGKPSTDPKTIAAEGFTEVEIYIDRERWIQVGTKLVRTEPGGEKVTLGTYFFRDVELKPTFADDTFTVAGLKK